MKLHSPAFEKALRQGVKQAVRQSPELRKEFRRINRHRHKRPNRGFVHLLNLLVAGGLVGILCLTTNQTGHLATGLALINLLMLWSLWAHAQGLNRCLYRTADLPALSLLPISRELLFRWQLQKFWRGSLLSLFYLLVGFGALAGIDGLPPLKWGGAFLVALVSWACLLALILFWVVRYSLKPLVMIAGGLTVMAVAMIVGFGLVGPAALQALDQSAPLLNLLLPTGWPVSLFETFSSNQQWWLILLLVPVGLVLATTRQSLRRLFASFQFREAVAPAAPDLLPEIEEAVAENVETGIRSPLGLTAIAEIVESRVFLQPLPWARRGWWEQRLWRWFSPREKVLSEFVFPSGYVVATLWKKVFRNLAIAGVASLAVSLVSQKWEFLTLAAGFFFTGIWALTLFNHTGRAFQKIQFSGVTIPMYAGYGIGFKELSGLLLKCSTFQAPFLLAFTVLAGVLTAALAELPIFLGIMFGLKLGVLVSAGRLPVLASRFSAGTMNNSRFSSTGWFFVFFFLVIFFLGLGGTGLAYPDQLQSWLLCLGAVLIAAGIFWIYRWHYHSGRLDIMCPVRR